MTSWRPAPGTLSTSTKSRTVQRAGTTGVSGSAAGPPPTFGQFLTTPNTVALQAACILGGVAAFPLCLLQAAGKGGKRPTLVQFILANVVTAVFATLAALMIGTLHLMPGGH